MLPYVDEFRPVHNLASLRALIASLSAPWPEPRLDARAAMAVQAAMKPSHVPRPKTC